MDGSHADAAQVGSAVIGPVAAVVFTMERAPGQCASDYNADGKSDILWRNTDGNAAIWLMNGLTLASGAGLGVVPTSWTIAGVGDFDGDGKADILWRNTDGSAAIWLMNGTTQVSGAGLGVVPTSWTIDGVGDFDGDGKADILWRNTDGSAAIWLMNGDAVSGAGLGVVPTSWTIAGVGDFDGDGKADILWRNTDGSAAIWLMNGLTQASGAGLGVVPTSWTIAGVGDFDGDGKTDILWRNTDGSAAIWLMNGTTFASGAGLGVVPTSWTIDGVGDFDGDGKSRHPVAQHRRERCDLADERHDLRQWSGTGCGADKLEHRQHALELPLARKVTLAVARRNSHAYKPRCGGVCVFLAPLACLNVQFGRKRPLASASARPAICPGPRCCPALTHINTCSTRRW